MRKYVVALCLLPLVGCAANPQTAKTAEECHIVQNDDSFSHIATKKVCTAAPEGGSAETTSESGTLPAPH